MRESTADVASLPSAIHPGVIRVSGGVYGGIRRCAEIGIRMPDRAAMRAVGVRRGYRQAKSSIGRAPRLASVLSAARVAAACDGGRAAVRLRAAANHDSARAPHEGA